MKFELCTPEKPEVFAITEAMGWNDPDLTVGKLFKLWRWFDQHTKDGNAPSVTLALLDRFTGVSGFAQAVLQAGWLEVYEDGKPGVRLPNFDRHNGETAKKRGLGQKRVQKHREKCNAKSVTEALPEKRREELSTYIQRQEAGEIPKSVDEVLTKAQMICLPPDEARNFFDHYEGNGWMTGANPVRDWTKKLNNWRADWQTKAARRPHNASKPKRRVQV